MTIRRELRREDGIHAISAIPDRSSLGNQVVPGAPRPRRQMHGAAALGRLSSMEAELQVQCGTSMRSYKLSTACAWQRGGKDEEHRGLVAFKAERDHADCSRAYCRSRKRRAWMSALSLCMLWLRTPSSPGHVASIVNRRLSLWAFQVSQYHTARRCTTPQLQMSCIH